MVAAHLLVAVLAGMVSALGGALLGHVGWVSLALYMGGGLSGLALTATIACCAALHRRDPAIQLAPEPPCTAETA